jgi:hypothetical protein
VIGEGLLPFVREHREHKREHAVDTDPAMAGVRRRYRNPVIREFAICLASSRTTTR